MTTMGSSLKPGDLSSPLECRHQEDAPESTGQGQKALLSARGTRRPVTQEQKNAWLRYAHLRDEDYERVESMLQGTTALNKIPRIKSKVIKMFISSTFSDMAVERNVLAEHVFPKLRSYCRDKYGIDFQAVDMRWGVSSDARDDHSGTELCLAELKHCQDVSIGPNFAFLVGQRYGACPLPASILRFHFDALRNQLVENGRDVSLLDQCYLRDHNAVPSVYRLQTISKLAETSDRPWSEIEADLKILVEEGADLAVKASTLKMDNKRMLLASVTELEVYEGLININQEKNRQNNCLLFVREIEGLHDNIPKTAKFLDLVNDTEVNEQAQTALGHLKQVSLRSLPRFNTCSAKVAWTGRGIDAEVDHKDYVDRLTDHFYHTSRALVDRNMMMYDQLASDELYHEVVGHWTMVATRCLTFVGREVPLMTVREYITQESNQPLVVHGESGMGKTSFLAKATSLIQSWAAGLPSPVKTSVVIRFVGISPKSSSIQQLLFSICHQVAFVTGRARQDIPQDYKRLKVYFIDLLQRGEVPGLLVILLDSLDQLSSDNGAHKLDWLPARIAPNIKVVVSTAIKKHGILTRLQSKMEDKSLLQLPPLPTTDAERIMKVLLEGAGRQVTLPQWRLIQEAFQHCTLPLFITLTFQEAARWRSYDEIQRDTLQHTVMASIQKLFERLEGKHGKVFVSRALAYITAARRGLTESELEDILSLDDDVLSSVFRFWLPPIRRVPPSLWPRLYLDIATFLVERDADEVTVLSWYHQQFADTAMERYLKDSIDLSHVHRTLAEYYQGTWSGTAQKPFILSPELTVRLRLVESRVKACRIVPDMPLVFCSSEVSERFNLRKMSQLPYSLILSFQFDQLRSQCLCNYQWLHTKLRATSVQQILADFALFDDKETDLVADVFRMSGSTLNHDPDRLAVEISGRLLPHIARYPAIRELVRQCDLASQMCCPLIPLAQLYAAPGGPLQYECDLEAKSAMDVDVFSSPDGILMTAKSYYSTCLKVWELTQGEPRQDLQLPVGQVHPSTDGQYLAILRGSRHVSIYDASSGHLNGHVDYDYGEVGSVAMSKKYLAVSVDRGFGPVVVDLDNACLLHRFAFMSRAVAISKDEKLLCFNTGPNLVLYSLPLMERQYIGEACSGTPQMIQFTQGSSKCFVLTESKMLQSVSFTVTSRRNRASHILCDLDMRDFVLSNNENLIVCRCSRWLHLVDAVRGRQLHRLQNAPDGVFKETMTNFTGVGFTPDDQLIVATRHTYLMVWNSTTGQPVRLLQAALVPVVKLYMSPASTVSGSASVNKAVTLLQDNTLQVWNLNNLDADVLHANEILKGAVKTLSVSSTCNLVACHGGVQGQAEIKLVDLTTGRVSDTLQQPASVHTITSLSFSPGGRYLLTWNVGVACQEQEGKDILIHVPRTTQSPLMPSVIVWDVEKHKTVLTKNKVRHAVFDKHGAALLLVQCTYYSRFDWTENVYKVTFVPLESDISGSQETHFTLPECTELVGTPILFNDRRSHSWAFISVLQFCFKTFERPSKEGKREYESVVFMKFFTRGYGTETKDQAELEPKSLWLSDLIRNCDEQDSIASVILLPTNLLMILYLKGVDNYVFDSSRGLVLPPNAEKGCVLYDVVKDVVVKHTLFVFSPATDLLYLQMCPTSAVFVDQNRQVFDVSKNRLLCQVKADWFPGSARLALEGRYVVALSGDCRDLQVYRCNDGTIKGTLRIHGKGTHLEVAEDGRTIAVGTSDGRVMLLNLILELSDPYIELIQTLPSRNPAPPPTFHGNGRKGSALMEKDVDIIRGKSPELQRLSAKIRADIHRAFKRQPSFRSISNAVVMAQKMHYSRSQACCLQ